MGISWRVWLFGVLSLFLRNVDQAIDKLWQHDKSILHLDLKPGNVLLTWDEERMMCVGL